VRKKIKIRNPKKRKIRNPTSRTRAKAVLVRAETEAVQTTRDLEKEKVKEVETAGVTMIQWTAAMISSIACADHMILDTELQLKKNLE